MSKILEVISRKDAEKTLVTGDGNLSVSLSSPSIIQIHGSAKDVAHYLRQGNDLLVYMKDGSVIRCNGYFVEEEGRSGHHSELVFDDGKALTHITFDEAGVAVGTQGTALTATSVPIESIEPFMDGSALGDVPWGWVAGAVAGGAGIGALLAHGGGKSHTTVIDNTKEVESARPTFTVTDNKGDSKGLLSSNAVTDDATPTFSGSGQPGATIQVKDSNGNTIASTMVDSNGNWKVLLSEQPDGTHTWSVVQIDGNKITSAGDITLNVVTTQASLTVATTAGDNMLNAAEQANDVVISGSSQALASGTALTLTLNGKTYSTTVGSDGSWSVTVPAADAKNLADGSWPVAVSGKDAAGNNVSASETLVVDTKAPGLTVNAIADDNIINAAEHGAAVIIGGKTDAEAGQVVTLKLNGKTYTATVNADGSWSMAVPADDVQTMADNSYTLNFSVSDKAGNTTTTNASLLVDTTPPEASVNTVAGDDILSVSEQGQAQIISGTSRGAAPGDKVTVSIGGKTWQTTVQQDGSWSVGVPKEVISSLPEGTNTVTVTITDAAGNSGRVEHDITVSSTPPAVAFHPISQDNVLNAIEATQPLTLSGTSNLPDGSTVTVRLNNVNYTADVQGGVWQLQVPVEDVVKLGDTTYTLSVSGTDSTGNTGTANATLLVDTALPTVVVSTFAGDNRINNSEIANDQTLSGRVTGAHEGDTVTLNVGGKNYTTKVQSDLTWSITVSAGDLQALGDGDVSIVASVTNGHGNTGRGDSSFNINAQLPGLRINTVSGDDVINAIEQHQDLTVSGTSAHLNAGTIITVRVNGVDYPAAVSATGTWQIGIPASDLASWPNGKLDISASSADEWGNPVAASRPVDVDLNAVAISINSVTSDDMLNAVEKAADLTLGGKTQGVEAGQTVVIKFAGHIYTTTVNENGDWTYTVPAADMRDMIDGRAEVSVSVTNASGNSASGAREVLVDTQPPSITLHSVTADNILNHAEAAQDLVITGTSTAQPGQTVTVSLNNQRYTGQVLADGTWSVTVPVADLANLTDGNWSISASVSDIAGNPVSTNHGMLVDTTVPVVTINVFAGDNIVNRTEHSQAQVLSGKATGAAVGDSVKVTVNGVEYSTVLDAGGNWSIGLPAEVISGLADGKYTATVAVTDKAGNVGGSSLAFDVATGLPQITINAIAQDDVINAVEKSAEVTISGTSNQPDGTQITVNLNGVDYAAVVNGSAWSVKIPAPDVAKLGEASYTVNASVTDASGNSNSASHSVLVDSSLPVITINTVAGDNIINLAEVNAGQVLSGSAFNAVAGDKVTVILGGKSYTVTVQSDLSWSLPLSKEMLTALGDGELTVHASVTNGRGNTGSTDHDITIAAQLPGLRINTIAGDDVINLAEHSQDLIVSGTSIGLSAGSVVTVTLNGKDYLATVNADGTWGAAVPGSDVSRWPDGVLTVTAKAEDGAQNPVSIDGIVDVDLAPVSISVNSVTADNVLNAAEKGSDLVLSGLTTNVEPGQTVTITFAGHRYTTSVNDDGSWRYTVPAADMAKLKDGDAQVTVSVSNVNGNPANAAQEYSVDASAPTLLIDPLSGDNLLNAAEAKQPLIVSGSSSAEPGQNVTVTLNNVNYTATVGADGRWSVSVPANDLAALKDGIITVSASVADKAGNPANADRGMLVDITEPKLTIDTVAGDDIINASEHNQAHTVSGTSTGAAAGDVVTVVVTNGQGTSFTFTTTLDARGNWNVGIPASVINGLADGSYTITASVTDAAGNSGSADRALGVNTALPAISIAAIAVDDVINATEKGQDLVLSGTSNQPAGTLITVTLNEINYQAVAGTDGSWSTTIPASAVSKLGEANYTVTAAVTDAHGNSNSDSHSVQVDSALPTVTINNVTSDNILNITEIASGQTLSGLVTGAAKGDIVTINLGGKLYQATVQDDLSWSLSVSKEILTALGNGDLTITASVTNGHGNTGSGSRDIVIDANLPGLRVGTVAGDDVINAIEHNQNLIINGTSTGLSAGSAVTVTINGKDYAATVRADGSWQAAVPGEDVARWAEGAVTIEVKGSSGAGNDVAIQHQVTVDLSEVVIGINAITGDNVLNAAEKSANLELSGTTQNVEPGQTVSITFAGHTYTATVQADGSWKYTVPAADMVNLKEGDTTVQVSVTNKNGNSTEAAQNVSVDSLAPTLTVDPVSQDNLLNAAEAKQDLIISGTSTAEAGQTVTVQLNGESYQAAVKADGSWSLTVPASDVGKLVEGNITVTASVEDRAGNPGSASRDVLVDKTVPEVTIGTVATDDVINQTEHGQAQVISGTSTGAQAGDIVTVKLGGKSYTGVVDASGNWSVGVPRADISALGDNTYTVTASITDKAGNTGDAVHSVKVDTAAPTLTIDIIAGDNILNADEKTGDVIISGSSTGLASGSAVTVHLNGKNYAATVGDDGKWSTTVPAGDVGKLGEAFYEVSVSASNGVGNAGSQSSTLEVASTLPGVIINAVAIDDIINASELAAGQTITGRVTGVQAGADVTINIGGVNYTAKVQSDLTWSLALSQDVLTALGDGSLKINASVTDGAGNTGTGSREVTIDAALPGIRINTIAGDDVINAIEHGLNLIINGTSRGLSEGSAVTVTINGKDYAATVRADGSWQTVVPGNEVSQWQAGDITVSAGGTSSSGNPVSIDHTVNVDLSAVAITIGQIAGDDVLNAAEKGADLLLSGATQNVEAGQTITITFAGHTYTTQVASDGSWTFTVPANDMKGLKDGETSVEVSVANVSGNGASAGREISVDTAAPTLQINTIAGDDVLNAAEAGQPLVINGASNAEPGQTVTVKLNNETYTGTVQADGTWSITVPAEKASALGDGVYSVEASVSDAAGNHTSANHNFSVDVTVPTISFGVVAGDDVINLAEHGQAQIISGSSSGAAAGDKITVTIGSNSWTTTVDAAGNWSIGVPASVVSQLADGTVTIHASLTDAAGNTGTGSHDVVVNTGLPSLSFNPLSGDNVLNASEKGETLTLSGTSANLAPGTAVIVTLNGKNYTATTDASGNWSVDVQPGDLAGLGEANYTLTATATSAIGNSASTHANLLVDTAAPGVTINPVTADNVLNASEIAAGQTLSGKVSNAAAGDTVTINLGGKTYAATVQSDLSWSLDLPASVLTALGNGKLTATASVTNGHGNSGTAEREFTIDASLPGLRIHTVAGDDVINAIEHNQNLIVSGSASGMSAGSTVTVTINGKGYLATVSASGTWSAAVPAEDVSQWAAGNVTVTAAGSSSAGNPISIDRMVNVDLSPVAVSVDAITADNVLNAAEKGADLVLSGKTQNVEAGQNVTLLFGGHTYTAQVAADGSWSYTVPAGDMAGLKDGDASVKASVTNVNGNGASAEREFSVDATPPGLAIDPIATDNVINAAEAGAGVVVTGTSNAEAGQTVTLTLDGKTYTGVVKADGTWSVTLDATALGSLADNNYQLSASVSDAAGNGSTSSKTITLDTTAPTIGFNVVAGDDIINFEEHAQAQIISGSSSGAAAGNKIVITLNGTQYVTQIDANGNWSIGVPASAISSLKNGTATITAMLTDSAGNEGTNSHTVEVNAVRVGLTIGTISDDDVINAAESQQDLVIGGGSTELAVGTQVTVTLNGVQYHTTVQQGGGWSVTVPANQVQNLVHGNGYTVVASATDGANNATSASHNITIDTAAPVITLADISGDNVLNAAEQQLPLTIRGTSSAEAGQKVTVKLGSGSYDATVQADGSWSVTVAADDLAKLTDGDFNVSASVQDKAGNPGSADRTLTVDTTPPGITFNKVAGDDIINSAEQQAGQVISGTTDAQPGQTVTVTFNNHAYKAVVSDTGTWSVTVPAQDFLGATDGSYQISASVSDKAGNSTSANKQVTLSGEVPTISVNDFAQDNIVSAAEHGTPLVISGVTNAPAGQTVTITLNNQSYTTTVNGDGTWSYTLGSGAVSALVDGGSYVIHASVNNSIGNSAGADRTVTVDTTPPQMTITIDALQNDTGLSKTDFITADNKVVVKGSLSAALGNNEKAQISLDGGSSWIDLVVNGKSWRYADGRTLPDGTVTYNVRVIDNAGNVGSTATQNVTIDTVAPDASKTITVEAITQDTGLDAHDFITSDNTLTISGKLGGMLAAGEHAQISIDGGKTWVDVSISGTTWSYIDSRTLADGDYLYQLRVIDDAGNIGATTSQLVTVDTVAPDASKSVTIDRIADDTGLSNSDFVTSDTSLTIHGSLGASLLDGEYVQISMDGGLTWKTVTTVGTTWYFTDGRTLTDGTYQYYVRVVDTAGNVGQSASQTVTVDTTPPDAAITVTVDSITTDSGFSNSDFITNDNTLTLNGSLGAVLGKNEYVQVSFDGGASWVNATSVNGTSWSYTDGRQLADGNHTWQVRIVDLAGNVGATTSQTVTVDTVAPTYGITIDSISDDTGQSASDFITMDTTLTLNGTLGHALASDERVQISLDGGQSWVDAVVNGTAWHYVDGRTLPDGDHLYQVRIIDQAGNVGSTAAQVVTVDTVAPDTVGTIVSYTDNDGERTGNFDSSYATDDTSPVLNGTLNHALAAGEIAQIFRDGVLVGKVTITGGTSWTFADSGLLDGNYHYVLRVTDKAGNYTESNDFTLTVDTSVPKTIAHVDAVSTSDTTPILTGDVSAQLVNGEFVVVTVNGKTYSSERGGPVVVDPSSNRWYLQIPDSDLLGLNSYNVTAQVKSSAGNGNNTGIQTGSLVVHAETANDTSWASAAGNANNSASTLMLNNNGLWTLVTNTSVYNGTDLNSYTQTSLPNTRANTVSYTALDFDRNGTVDIYGTETTYGNAVQTMWIANANGTYTTSTQANGTTIWYGGVIAYDKNGDGYVDLAYGDAGGDSRTYLINNKGSMVADGTNGNGGLTGVSYRELSGVDINNDGNIDIVQHTNSNGTSALSVISNNGSKLTTLQSIANVFVDNAANTTTAASMTWADFNGDGYLDLYIATGRSVTSATVNYSGKIFYNDGNGQLNSNYTSVESTSTAANAGYMSVAVDWDGDGDMDIVKFSTYGTSQTARLFSNDGTGKNWTESQLAKGLVNVTGVAVADYDWNGTQDLLVSQQNGKVVLVANTNTIAPGTAMHLRIVDSEGINVFYGNTVRLYDSAGKLVSTQIINAQSGIGANDASALVSFYGLNPNETYHAELVRAINGVTSNVTWNGLTAGDGKESYALTAEAATGVHGGTLNGTGYNDTFIAEQGTYVYNGGGGWETSSDHQTWSATGGLDVVDFRNSGVGVTVDLGKTGAQNTGFNTATFTNIEGIVGSSHDDVITGNSGNNTFEGGGGNDTFNIGSGGHDTLLYKLLNSSDATGGNGHDVVNGFSVGTWEGTADSDRIDLRELLQGSGYAGDASAHYINGVAQLGAGAGNIGDYIKVVQNGSNTEIQIDRDGKGGAFDPTTVVTLNGVQTDLATLLANHQLLVI
ncbi:Ig-like domain-containing protein [Enterobacter sp. Cy-643]|uniref:Ig-like domain-containing protein n=1 Tax=Enterobacter sp. Cy-643 TaxID=2608346 RepID=UPI00141EFC9C|nr:Ig-like domain-containing protein [Enterobacter sp. Cy-643]NIF31610.1 Ig-like domain-containing protein [Enterobacter sp. Cy-643]